MNLSIRIDEKDAIAFFKTLGQDAPYWIANALNRTGEDALAAIRSHVPRAFTIREPGLLRYVAPLKLPPESRARKNRLTATLDTKGAGRILNPYEQGIPKGPDSLGRLPAVPGAYLRPTKQAKIPRLFYPHNLGLVPYRDASGMTFYALGRGSKINRMAPKKSRSGNVLYGKRRTFMVTRSDGAKHILMRVGPGPRGLVRLWTLTPLVRRPKLLGFRDTIQRVVNERWRINAEGMIRAGLEQAVRRRQ
jgi:hypothetical protein